MTDVQLGPVTFTLNATASAPVTTPEIFIKESTGKQRVFEVDDVEITYAQEYTQGGGGVDEAVGPWTATAVVSGQVYGSSGNAGARRTSRAYTDEDAPEWLRKIIVDCKPKGH